MLKFTLVIILSAVSVLEAMSQVDNSSNCKKAYKEIISLRFEQAEKYIEAERDSFPENVYISYLQNYIDFFKIFIS